MPHRPFSSQALREAHAAAKRAAAVAKTRPLINVATIDGPQSTDLDDGFWVQETSTGFDVLVAISDVALLLSEAPALQREVLSRSFTRYRSTGPEFMLPRFLAQGAASLQPGDPKPVFVTTMQFGLDGRLRNAEWHRASAQSVARLTYTSASQAAEQPTSVGRMMVGASRLTRQLERSRRNSGTPVYYDFDRLVATDESGALVAIPKYAATEGYRIVAELMIATNAANASKALEVGLPVLYRNHRRSPGAASETEFVQDVFEALSDPTGKQLALLQQTTQLASGRAQYDVHARGHQALHLPAYMHSTSPGRRAADAVSQMSMASYVDHEEPPFDNRALAGHATHINAAVESERQSTGRFMHDKADSERLQAGGSAAFQVRLRDAIRGKSIPINLPDETVTYIRSGEIEDRRLAELVVVAGVEGTIDKSVRQELGDYLSQNPKRALMILSHAQQVQLLNVERTSNATPSGSFEVTFRISSNGDTKVLESSAIEPSVKSAVDRAGVLVLANYLGVRLEAMETVQDDVDQRAYKTELFELCLAAGIAVPEYSIEGVKPPFTSRLRLTVGEETREFNATANSKRAAEWHSSKDAVVTLGGELAGLVSQRQATTHVVVQGRDYVGAVNTWLARHPGNWSPAQYEFERIAETPTSWRCLATVSNGEGEYLAVGEATRKDVAKKDAAQGLFEQLTGRGLEPSL